MLKGFRDFITRGNVVDLAVGFVIGAAFGAVINQFTRSFLEPAIKLLTGGQEAGGTFKINGVVFDYGAFINAIITFLLTAAALYFLVIVPVNRLNERRARAGKLPPEQMNDEVRLLTEIRDGLARR